MLKKYGGAGSPFGAGRWAVAIALAFGAGTPARAASIDLDSQDWKLRWDNTVRYNLGVRVEDIDDTFGNSTSYDETEYSFEQGDLVTNRLDLISEADLVYRNRHGFRISGAGWYDQAYDGDVNTNPGVYTNPATMQSLPYSSLGAYVDNEFTSTTERFHRGPSGELLDAFAFTQFRLGPVQVNLKAGQHTVYWGEALLTQFHGIAYSQEPIDGLKAATSPGIEAKEVFRPINQISFQAQLSRSLSVAGQYFLDWKPNRLPQGGTYFGSQDSIFDGPERLYLTTLPPGAIPGTTTPVAVFAPHNDNVEPEDDHGNWGINLRWSPAWAEGTFGFYYRVFDETQPWPVVLTIAPPSQLPAGYHQAYAEDTRMYALSYSTTIGTVSVGSELSYRKDAALNSISSFAATGDLYGVEGARGDTWHALINGIYLLPRTPLWIGGTLQGEVVYSKLDKVTKNEVLFNGVDTANCPTHNLDAGCVSDDVLLAQIGFTPEWPQALPGWDLSMPTSFAYGIDGNGATLGGGNEGAYTMSIGIGAKFRVVNDFSLKYNDSHNDYTTDANGVVAAVNGNAAQNSHGWVSFTFKRTF